MSVSEIGHSGRYVINFYFLKARQNHYSFPGNPKDLGELKKDAVYKKGTPVSGIVWPPLILGGLFVYLYRCFFDG